TLSKKPFPSVAMTPAEAQAIILEKVAADAAHPTPVEMAKAAILNLLAVREERLIRFKTIKERDPAHSWLQNNWADEDMLGEKLIRRVLDPEIKTYLLDPRRPRDEARMQNPCAVDGLTEEVVQQAIDELTNQHKIAKAKSTHVHR